MTEETDKPFISARLVAGLVVVSALSALVFLVLSAYAPDLRSDVSGGGNAMSKSAIGYAGLRIEMDAVGMPSFLSRSLQGPDMASLVVLAPEPFVSAAEIEKLASPGRRLIVLPKWVVVGDPTHRGWVMQMGTLEPAEVAQLLDRVANGVKVSQSTSKGPVHLTALFDRFAPVIPSTPLAIDRLQTLTGKAIEPDIVDEQDHTVLGHVRGTRIYVLSDPDFLNNRGLHDRAVSEMALRTIATLSWGTPVVFDVTLNGFGRAPDLLRAAFAPPFLGATLCAIAAAALMAFHALVRFGAARPPDRVFAFGKRALADNTAAVIRLMRREPQMAPRYALAMLDLVAARLGASRERTADPAWIAALEKRSGGDLRFADLRAEAASVEDTGALIRVAAKLYRWRRGILHERR